MLDTKTGLGASKWTNLSRHSRDKLNRITEVVHSECMVAEESCSYSGVEGDQSLPAAQRETGTAVIIRLLSFASVSSPALAISLVVRSHMLSPSGRDQGSLMSAATSARWE